MRLVIVSVFVETLTMMAVGALLAAVISVLVLRSEAYIWLSAFAIATAAGVPTLPPVLRWLGRTGAKRFAQGAQDEAAAEKADDVQSRLSQITFRVLSTGWLAAIACWLLFAISLWATLRGIGVNEIPLMASLPTLLTAVACAVVAGFASMVPGGLGVRDFTLLYLLAPVCGEANALVAAVLMRLVWLVSEVAACGILYIGARSKDQAARSSAS
jgi:glycosyltransferase 2 family protein